MKEKSSTQHPHKTVKKMRPPFGGASLHLKQTAKPVTPFGGVAAFAQLLQNIGWSRMLEEHMPIEYRSRNAIKPAHTLTMFMVSVLVGAKRFAHSAMLKADRALHAILGIERCPGDDAVRSFFGRFDAAKIEALWRPLWKWMLQRVPPREEGYTLDLDSSVFERYGHQQGAQKGYNPSRRGQPSHHPLLAVLSEVHVVLHGWLRPGSTTASSGVVNFLCEALEIARQAGIGIHTLRADCGFYGLPLLEYLEQKGLGYLIIARQTGRVNRLVQGIEQWQKLADGSEVGEFTAKVGDWKMARRFLVLRRPARESQQEGQLLALPRYIYRVLVTNRSESAAELWRMYDGRARIELCIRELKEDLHVQGFCLRNFHGSESAFLAVLCLYNLLSEFQRATALPGGQRKTSRTLREEVIVCGAILGRSARQLVLHFSMAWGGLERRNILFEKLLHWPNQKTPFLASAF